MKYRIVGMIACLALLLVSILPALWVDRNDRQRYHQHLHDEPKAACTHAGDTLCSHLPLVMIDTGGEMIPGEPILDSAGGHTIAYTRSETGAEAIISDFAVIDNADTRNHIADEAAISTQVEIRIRGNSSRHFEKKGYDLRLVTAEGTNDPQAVMGMDVHHEWALHGPYLDKTLIRNYLCYNLAGEIMDYAPNARFCELVINGEYMGLYLMTETITAGKDGARLSLSVDKKDNTFTGYLLRLDRGSMTPMKNISSLSAYTYRTEQTLNIVYPGSLNLTRTLADSICADFSAFEKALYSYDFRDDEHGYETYLDVDSFIDYFLINEFTCNYDAGRYSTYIYLGTDGKFRMCVWDFNNAFDNYQENAIAYRQFALQDSLWFDMLFRDEAFTERVIDRWHALEADYLNTDYLNAYIDDTIAYLGDAIDRNFVRWGHTFTTEWDRLLPLERNLHTYDDAVEQLKDFITDRHVWMDQNIEILRQYSAGSKIRPYIY